MPKQVRHDKNVILNLALKQVQGLRFQNPILTFDITDLDIPSHLKFESQYKYNELRKEW